MAQITRKEKFELMAQKFVIFAIPDPNAPISELKKRGRVMMTFVLMFFLLSSVVYAEIGIYRQKEIVKNAVIIAKTGVLCQNVKKKILETCMDVSVWNLSSTESQKAWVASKFYENPKITILHVLKGKTKTLLATYSVNDQIN